MSKPFTRLSPALLALALLVSAAASARAQDSEPGPDTAARAEAQVTDAQVTGAQVTGAQVTDAQGGPAGGAQQQQQEPTPTPTPQATRRAPLTGEQKIKRAFRSAFLTPEPYAMAIFNGGLRQINEDRLPHKDGGDEVADFGSHVARSFATGVSFRLLASGVYPTLFKQDPRYERSTKKAFGRRALHAVSRLFVTRDDDGNLEPNYSRFAGAMTSSALANIWERNTPGHDRIGVSPTLRRFGYSFLSGAITNVVFRELLGR